MTDPAFKGNVLNKAVFYSLFILRFTIHLVRSFRQKYMRLMRTNSLGGIYETQS